METVVFKVFASRSADKPLLERVIFPVKGLRLDYDNIISALRQLFGSTCLIIITSEFVEK